MFPDHAGAATANPTLGAALPRRAWLAAAGHASVAALAIGLGGCAQVGALAGRGEPVAQAVAPGVFLFRGTGGQPDASNLGRTGNAGFIVGPEGVIAVDTGTSYLHGTALLAAIRRVTPLPVRLAVVTHTRQEFLFGAAAFREQGIPVQMHARAARLMAARCEGCLKTLRQTIGEEAMRGTVMFKPDIEFDSSEVNTLTGRRVQLLYFGHSSGPGDIAVLDDTSGVVFAGGLLDVQRIPDVIDSQLPGWKAALAGLRQLPLRQVVAGHGPAAPVSAVDGVERYLTQLEARLKNLLDTGAALSEVPDATVLPEFADWDQYALIHRRNASVVFLRLEREQLLK